MHGQAMRSSAVSLQEEEKASRKKRSFLLDRGLVAEHGTTLSSEVLTRGFGEERLRLGPVVRWSEIVYKED